MKMVLQILVEDEPVIWVVVSWSSSCHLISVCEVFTRVVRTLLNLGKCLVGISICRLKF